MEENKKCAELINSELKPYLEHILKNKLGIETNIHANAHDRFVDICDCNCDVQNKLRGNKLLRNMFKSVTLGGMAFLDMESDSVVINLRISYTHPNGGSNGRELGKLIINTTTKKYSFIP